MPELSLETALVAGPNLGRMVAFVGAEQKRDGVKWQADYPLVSYADLYQMAAAVAIEHAGGPKIDMKYGRKDPID